MLGEYFLSASFISKYYFVNTFYDVFELLKGYRNKVQLITNSISNTLNCKVVIYVDPNKQVFSSNNSYLNRLFLKYDLSKLKPEKIRKIITLTCHENHCIDFIKIKIFGQIGYLYLVRDKKTDINKELLDFYIYFIKYLDVEKVNKNDKLCAYSINEISENAKTIFVSDDLLSLIGYNQEEFNKLVDGEIKKLVHPDDLEVCHRVILNNDYTNYYFLLRIYNSNDFTKYFLTEFTRLKNSNKFFIKYIDVSNYIDSVIPSSNHNNLFVKYNYFNNLIILDESNNYTINYADKDLCELLGISYDLLDKTGKYSFLKYIKRKNLNSFIRILNESARINKSVFVELEIKNRNGDYYSYVVMTLPSFDDGKRIISVINSNSPSFENNSDDSIVNSRIIINDKISIIEGPKFLRNVFNHHFSFFDVIYPNDLVQANKCLERMKKGLPFSTDLRILISDNYTWCSVEGNYIQSFGSGSIYNFSYRKNGRCDLYLLDENKYDITDLDTYSFEYDIINDKYYGKLFYFDKTEDVGIDEIEGYLVKLLRIHNYNFDKIYRWVDFITGKKVKTFTDELTINGKRLIISISGQIYYEDNVPSKVIGTFTDVTSKYRDDESFTKNTHIDYLTRIYNKTYGEFLIRSFLSSTFSENYLVCVDIVNFKRFNLEFGYMFGNVVLAEFAILLRSFLNSSDILYRLENDDFIILLKNRTVDDVIEFKKKVEANIGSLFIDHCDDIKINCAISYIKLTKREDFDRALNFIVDEVRNSYYDINNNYVQRRNYDFVDELKNNSQDDIIYLALDLLEKTHNVDNAIHILLCRIGKRFNLSSIHILKYNYTDRSVNLINYWNALDSDSVFPEKIRLTGEEFEHINNVYDINGMANFNYFDFKRFNQNTLDRDDLDNKVFFSCANFEDDLISSNIVFEPIKENYIIPKEQRYILNAIAKIIFVHLKKADLDNLVKEKIEYISRIGHEIRNPLNGVIGVCNIAKNYINDSKRLRSYLDKVDTSGKYLLSLVNSLLDLNKAEYGRLELVHEPVVLNDYFTSLETLVKVQAEMKNINLIFNCNYSCPYVFLDSTRLNQVLINLLGNAFKFTPEGGMVILDVHETENAEDYIVLKISVQDNGIGISKDEIKNIFLPFKQASPNISKKYGGTGLGLTISNNIVKLMGGILEVESELGKGTRFYFSIKLKKNDKCKIEKEITTVDVYSKQLYKKRVLVVDDNELNREIVATLLSNVGVITEQASSAKEAIEMYSGSPNDYYDYILMDYLMPEMNGVDATALIRNINRDDALKIPIIAITANAIDDTEENLYSGFNGYVPKPINDIRLYKELIKFI